MVTWTYWLHIILQKPVFLNFGLLNEFQQKRHWFWMSESFILEKHAYDLEVYLYITVMGHKYYNGFLRFVQQNTDHHFVSQKPGTLCLTQLQHISVVDQFLLCNQNPLVKDDFLPVWELTASIYPRNSQHQRKLK